MRRKSRPYLVAVLFVAFLMFSFTAPTLADSTPGISGIPGIPGIGSLGFSSTGEGNLSNAVVNIFPSTTVPPGTVTPASSVLYYPQGGDSSLYAVPVVSDPNLIAQINDQTQMLQQETTMLENALTALKSAASSSPSGTGTLFSINLSCLLSCRNMKRTRCLTSVLFIACLTICTRAQAQQAVADIPIFPPQNLAAGYGILYFPGDNEGSVFATPVLSDPNLIAAITAQNQALQKELSAMNALLNQMTLEMLSLGSAVGTTINCLVC